MQNHPNKVGPGGPEPSDSPLAALAQPRLVLLAVGLLGLALDIFVRPLSWIGLALIVLASSPWILQAWSERVVPAATSRRAPVPSSDPAPEATGKPRPDQRTAGREAVTRPEPRNVGGGQRTGPAQPVQAPLPMRDPPRARPPAEPAAGPTPVTNPAR
jgi:hypothetical protein